MIITDINDNTPVFADQSGMVSVMVAEHSPMNTLLTVLSATDADFDQLNSEIFFSITAGNDDGMYSIVKTWIHVNRTACANALLADTCD